MPVRLRRLQAGGRLRDRRRRRSPGHVAERASAILNDDDRPAADVVVAAAHESFFYDELREATPARCCAAPRWCRRADDVPDARGPWPGTEQVVAALEAASGAAGAHFGKPEPRPFRTALDRLGPGPRAGRRRRLDADVVGAARRPALTALRAPAAAAGGGEGGEQRQHSWPRIARRARRRLAAALRLAARGPRRSACIVNPHAGGGRAARAAPGRRGRARAPRRRLPHRATRSPSSTPGTLAGEAAAGGRGGRRRSAATGSSAPSPARCATPGRPARRPPRRPRQRLRARARASRSSRSRPCAVLAAGRRARPRHRRRSTDRSFIGIASLGFDSDANRIANEAPSRLGHARLRLRRAARAGRAGSPRRFTVEVDGEARTFRGWQRRRRQLQGLRRRHVRRARTPSSTTALLDVVLSADVEQAAFLRGAARRSSRARTSTRGRRRRPARRRASGSTPTARSRSTPTATRSASCPSRSAPCPRALQVMVPAERC